MTLNFKVIGLGRAIGSSWNELPDHETLEIKNRCSSMCIS